VDAAALATDADTVLWRLREVTLAGRSSPRLNGITLDIPRGITAVLGESGAGKTSLLNLLVGFERPTSGVVERSIHTRDRLPVFWSPSDHGLWPRHTVLQHLQGVWSEPALVFSRHLSHGHLSPLAEARPSTLSLGERSRLSVARALASGAAVIVLDEPFAHVDSQLQRWLWESLAETVRLQRQSVVFATHHYQAALAYADHVICLGDGKVLATGSPQALYAQPETLQVANLFGPCNWLTADDRRNWLPEASQPCVRPEQLTIEPNEASAIHVTSATFCGDHEVVVVQRKTDGAAKQFIHRPPVPQLRAGRTVRVRLLAMLCLVLAVVGCDSGADPALIVRSEEVWTLPPEGTKFPAPRAITAGSDGESFVLDNAGRVLVLDDRGECLRKWWMPEYTVGKPERVLVCRDGTLAIADTHYHRVVLFDQQGQLKSMFGRHGEGPGEFIYPVAIAEDDRHNLYVCEYGGHDRVQVFRPDGTYVSEFGSFGAGPGQFQRPSGILWRDGKLYIVDAFNNRVQVFHEDGRLAELPPDAFTAELHYPYDIASANDGRFYVVEYGTGRVTCFDNDGRLLGRYGHSGDGAGQLSRPWGLGVDDRGRVLIADTDNRRVIRWEVGK